MKKLIYSRLGRGIKDVIGSIMFEYNTIYNFIMLWFKKRKANKMHRLTGKRYHVVPSDTGLMVVDNEYVAAYNRVIKRNGVGKKITFLDLIRLSYYSTSVQGLTRKGGKNV